jgi:hypothetical protein
MYRICRIRGLIFYFGSSVKTYICIHMFNCNSCKIYLSLQTLLNYRRLIT